MTAVIDPPSQQGASATLVVGRAVLASPAAPLAPAPEAGDVLGRARRLIFENVANGVPMPKIMAAFRRSEPEVWREVEFVGRKIREARFRTRMPPVETRGIQAIRFNRRVLLETLGKLTDTYLSSELIIPRIGVQDLDDKAVIREAVAHLKGRTTENGR